MKDIDKMAHEIKVNYSGKNKIIYEDKMKKVEQLERKIELMKKEILQRSNDYKNTVLNKSKMEFEVVVCEKRKMVKSHSLNFIKKEFFDLKLQIENLERQLIEEKSRGFDDISEEIKLEKDQISLIKEEIKKANFIIGNIQKEKDLIKEAVSITKKHIEELLCKVKIKENKAKLFVNNVTSIINVGNLTKTKSEKKILCLNKIRFLIII